MGHFGEFSFRLLVIKQCGHGKDRKAIRETKVAGANANNVHCPKNQANSFKNLDLSGQVPVNYGA